jgi:hypothetical protein
MALICSAAVSFAQAPLTTDDALKQLYHDYDPAKKTARWTCTNDQQAEKADRLCSYLKNNDPVSVSVLLAAQVPEGSATRFYLVASAKPIWVGTEFDCHACIPATGIAVLVWKGERWILGSADAAADYSGGWGEPPRVDLVTIGPEKHGLLLSSTNMSQGFVSSLKVLLAPIGKSVDEIWSLEDDSDNLAAIDPKDRLLKMPPCRGSAAFRFLAGDEETSDTADYYDIEVISRGSSFEDFGHPVKEENWTAIYTFKNGKYELSRRVAFIETKDRRKTTGH